MDHVDHIAHRVSAAALSGLFLGAGMAVHRGSPVPRTAMSVAASCAMIGTACFGIERIASLIQDRVIGPAAAGDTTHTQFYTSHAFGGLVGGGIAGYLFQRKPFGGMMLFTPVMMTFALLELTLNEYREERLRMLLSKIKEKDSREQEEQKRA
mmetsp:Transcript_5028/g.8839  ORF Transcript_5028/g.8839 Transcript_5028/m.8839 type:complete len:153 (-) Transcript_5028:391-849(-)|eukprot:CAMPEP_0198289864 /NCGR_PEP_ID=MMETSP1449-20131203/7921_1 /TAXON_ID=420275 /ORGANISM="Attheya septentrionalis, Strain CCMP2084" /LENGTH=152 /DNA_ID=CAMNT_0043988269 /DNA_START=102 /DNA_END=560 /DNA_ORIENTATION=-